MALPVDRFAVLRRAALLSLVLPLAMGAAGALAERPKHDFEAQGVREGERVPDLTVYTANGAPLRLSQLWADRPLLLLTGSVTCHVSRRELPRAEPIVARFGDRISAALLYVIEPHPWDDPSPYLVDGREWFPVANWIDGVFRRQPLTLDERAGYAEELIAHIGLPLPTLVDGMDNRAWRMLGGGANMALLIRDGMVVEKQGWFEPEAMQRAIERLLSH